MKNYKQFARGPHEVLPIFVYVHRRERKDGRGLGPSRSTEGRKGIDWREGGSGTVGLAEGRKGVDRVRVGSGRVGQRMLWRVRNAFRPSLQESIGYAKHTK